MQLATTLIRIWSLRVWMAIGVALGLAGAAASLTLLHSQVYSAASTQMVVDSSGSALGDWQDDLAPFTTRAFVYARLMTTPQAMQFIGAAAGVPGNLIAASGPEELNGPQSTHAPTTSQGGQLSSAPAKFKLNFLQNPELPTVDVYAEAPTTRQALALANGAVTGFGQYINALDNQSAVPPAQRVTIRPVGTATGGVVDASASKSLAAIIFLLVVAIWSSLVLFLSNLRGHLRIAAEQRRSQRAAPAIEDSPVPPPLVNPPLAAVVADRVSAYGRAGGGVSQPPPDYELDSDPSSNGTGHSSHAAGWRPVWARQDS